MRKIVAIVGPTASGKTGLGVAIAKKYSAKGRPASGWNGAEIVSADSRQVFRGLDIGTGKDLKEYGDIKYHLIDICDPGEKFTMFDWLDQARIVIDDIFTRGKLPVIVGGTGLYVQALVEGFTLAKVESIKYKVESYGREQLNAMSLDELRSILRKLETKNQQLETIDIQNPRRLIRAIEKAQEGNIPNKAKPDFEVLQIALDFPREVLYERIDKRVEERFDQGMLREIENLIKSGVDPVWLYWLGLEYRIISKYALNPENQNFEAMKQVMKWKIHQFARRQLTWFRRFPEIVWIKDKKEAFGIINDFLKK